MKTPLVLNKIIILVLIVFSATIFGCKKETPTTLPIIQATSVSKITENSALCSCVITNTDDARITKKGFCWSTIENPTIADSIINDESLSYSFEKKISELKPLTTYFVRSYATNSLGTVYGDEVSFVTITYGSNYAGGIVFYKDSLGHHGLVCAPVDQSSGAAWGSSGVFIPGADGYDVGTGSQNTINIVNACSTSGIAARICYDLDLNGYTDWFLPSGSETFYLWNNYLKNRSIDGFGYGYWTSTGCPDVESLKNYALARNFASEPWNSYYSYKNSYLHVRAVRAF